MSRHRINAETRQASLAVSRLKDQTDRVLQALIELQGSPLLFPGAGAEGTEGDDAARELHAQWLPLLARFAAVTDGFQALGGELLAVSTAGSLMHVVPQPARTAVDPMHLLSSRGLPELEREGEEAKEDFAQSGQWGSLAKEALTKECELYNEEIQFLLDIVQQVGGSGEERMGPSSPSPLPQKTGGLADEATEPSPSVLGKRSGPSTKSERPELEALVESMTKGKRLKSNKATQ